jgi:Rrf2 family nitric oxide-sensitive transcriptional repressor
MRITNYTTYAIRTLMFAALNDDRLCQAQEVANAFGISKSHLVKCVHQLGQWGFLQCVRGRNGGFRLAKPPTEITIGAIVRKTEDTLELVECFNAQTNSCPLISSCLLSQALQRAAGAFIAELDSISIYDVTRNKRVLLDLLAVREEPVLAAS